jgi:hypothetical protein
MNKLACRYAIVQFSPYTETGEFANVGIVLTCPQTGFFGFKLQTKKYARITGFFNEINGNIYREAVNAMEVELERIKQVALQFDGVQRADALRQLFTHLVHPREAIIRFGEARAILVNAPAEELEQLFDYYVDHSFATPEYVEHTMTKRLQVMLNRLNLEQPFRPARLGDDVVYANFQLVQKNFDQPQKIIKAFNLDQKEPTTIFAHGDVWIQRVRRLLERKLLPENTLFSVALPAQEDVKRYAASQEIVSELKRQKIIVVNQTSDEQIKAFALAH